ncbi:unnamed protein product [Mytilus coruscus]|uniref:COR domain-containing protein n=1 Tax=Mytilus coruscus TaxID=42192 RepID=A0A6J8EEI3_MYTCO|nr:unnamed protein product [Mytilus coruscus]
MVTLNGAYDFICPSQPHWNIRAKSMCKPPSNYTCLFDVNFQINVYRDKCNRPRILGPGYKYVFQPNLNRAACSVNRYQPFIFETIGYSDCTFQKSFCNSQGQETYENSNTRSDTTCICNTDRGYTFVRNSKNQCYCNPSTEDCSCYLGTNQYNTTVGLEDTYRIEAAKLVLMLSLAYVLPEAINQLSEEDKIRYNKLIQTEKTEKRYFVRIMIVGKESVGKTCLLRRLLKEDISDVKSTDGVDIVVRRCKINIKDGHWIIGKEIDDDKVSRIKRALNPKADTDTQIMKVDETKKIDINQSDEMSTDKKEMTTYTKVSMDKSDDKKESSSLVIPEDLYTDAKVNHVKNKDTNESASLGVHTDVAIDTKGNLDKNEDTNESASLVMPADLMSNVFSKSTENTLSNLYALCDLWDFAGQKEFYATHQAFLTSSAVYLVVADMKDDISKQGLSRCFADFQHIGEYVDFWFDSIHCHRTVDEPTSDGHFDPPTLLVFTGKDKYDKAGFKKRESEIKYQMDKVFGLQSKYHHLHNTFYLSNTEDIDEVFEKFQNAVSEAARKTDNWGNAFPLKWILLEHLIDINKKDGKNFINFTDMSNLAKHPDINCLKKEDLLLFLRFQHNVGNIIFFENIPDLIILNPQWLADAFRCLVSDRVENSRLYHLEDWTLFKRQGKISESLITELFESKDGSQFSGQKNNLHKVMEKLDILVKIENSSYYIMPSEMPSSTFDIVCEKFGILTQNCKRTSWLCFKFEFLPPSFFNHLSAWFIRNYYTSKVEGGIALYRGICMFDIDGSGGTKILVTMSTDTIALQVVTFSEQQAGLGSTCSGIYNEVTQLFKDIKERYKVKISFKLHFKCSDGNFFQDTFEYENLTIEKECFCTQHKQMHRSDQIYSPWMNNESAKNMLTLKQNVLIPRQREKAIGRLNAGQRPQDVANAFNSNVRTIQRLRERHNTPNSTNDRPRTGRPRVTTLRQDRYILRHHLQNRFLCATHTARQTIGINQRPISDDTVRHESGYCISNADGRTRIWRRQGEKYEDNCMIERDPWRGPNIMVWGGIGLNHKIGSVVFQNLGPGRGNGVNATTNFRPHVVPHFACYQNNTSQHDNARAHTARATRDFLKQNDITIMPWSALSSDLNPIDGTRFREK